MAKRKTTKRDSRFTRFDDQTRFNWGYHDANMESTRGHARIPLLAGSQDTLRVSKEFDPDYYHGYVAGLADTKTGEYHGDSLKAWQKFNSTSVL